jgi:hypothetical protein
MNFDYFSNTDGTIDVTLISSTGQTVYKNQISVTKGKSSKAIDVSDIKQGVYIFSLKSPHGVSTKKIIIN